MDDQTLVPQEELEEAHKQLLQAYVAFVQKNAPKVPDMDLFQVINFAQAVKGMRETFF